MRKSFGFDDPFGLATAGHLDAATMHPDFAPFFVQYSFRGTELSGPLPGDAVLTATRAISNARFRSPWGADADLLRNPQEVEIAATAGFTCFTLDPSDFIRTDIDSLDAAQVAGVLDGLIEEGIFSEDWCQPYLDRTIDLPGSERLTLTLEPLRRAAVKYGRAIRHCARLSEAVARANHGHPFEMEAFFGATPGLTTALEHLFIGLELEARGVRLTALALRLVGAADIESVAAAEVRLNQHVAVAEFCGPYKLSFHDLSFLPLLCPLVGRCCRDALHVKTSGLSYLEALRVLERTDPPLLERVVESLPKDDSARSPVNARAALYEVVAQNGESGRPDAATLLAQSMLGLFSSTLAESRAVMEAVVATLEQHGDIYRAQLADVFDKRLSLLNVG